MANDIEDKKRALLEAYESWITKVLSIENIGARSNQPKTFKEDIFSNPYVISIPDDWQQSDIRVLIVGEEGYNAEDVPNDGDETTNYEHGETYRYKFHKFAPICDVNSMVVKMQKFNHAYGHDVEVKLPNSPFWRRIDSIRQLAGEASKSFSYCWTDIDKIHRIKTSENKDCKLTPAQRKALHSSEKTAILKKEIEILEPTHVVFFGWYGVSLQHELLEIYNILYGVADGSEGNKKKEQWYDKNGKIIPYVISPKEENAPYYIFTYHPGWHGIKDYNKSVLEEISGTFN